MPGRWETNRAVTASLSQMVQFGLPTDYFDTYAAKVRALSLPDVNAVAKKLVQPVGVVWVVIGDRAKIEAGIRSLNLGNVNVIDADGNAVMK
jgi:zinc protease